MNEGSRRIFFRKIQIVRSLLPRKRLYFFIVAHLPSFSLFLLFSTKVIESPISRDIHIPSRFDLPGGITSGMNTTLLHCTAAAYIGRLLVSWDACWRAWSGLLKRTFAFRLQRD